MYLQHFTFMKKNNNKNQEQLREKYISKYLAQEQKLTYI